MKTIYRVLAPAVICLTLISAHAQPGRMGGGPNRGMLAGATAKLFGQNSAFSAVMENQVKMEGKPEPIMMPGKLSFDGGKSRFEMNMADAKGTGMPPGAAEQMKAMGMDKMIAISRPDTKTAFVIYPGLQAYAAMPMEDTSATAPDSAFKIKTTELGKETFDGHPCIKNKTIVTDEKGTNHESTVWNATDLKNFPIKIETSEQGNQVTMLFKDVTIAKPEAKLFDPPADYTKYEDMRAMMQAEMMKRMGGAGAPGGGMTPPPQKP